MAETPNIEVLRELLNKIDSEFDLESRLNRYISVSPELIELGKNSGLSSDLDAARALFVSDFIVTTSEMPANTSDEVRRKVIIDSFLKGLLERDKSSDKLMRIFFLAVKTSSMMRRTDLFLADRGLNREPSLIMLKDFYVEPYLALCSEYLDKGSCSWELSILSALLKKSIPANEFEFFSQVPSYSPEEDLSYYVWNMLEAYSETQLLTPNTQIILPNVEGTSSILVGSSKPEFTFSFWNTDTPRSSLKDNQNALEFLHKYLGKTDNSRSLVYVRARLPKLQEQFIVVRNPFSDIKPFVILKTSADEINLSEALTLLDFRSREVKSWLDITKPPKKAKKQQAASQSSSSTQLIDQKSETLGEKKGFFSKVFGGLFGGAKDKGMSPSVKVDKPKQSKESKKKTSRQKGNSNLPYFLAHATTASLVGDLQLFEIFDTYRESKYAVQGSFELDYSTKKAKLITRKKLANPQDIGELINGLDVVLTTIIKHFYDEEIRVIPEEILFVSKNDSRTIVCLESSDDRLVGTLGTTFVKDVVDWKAKEEDIVQRRTLQMRTGQLLQARRHTPLDEAINRIYQGALDEDVDEITLDQKTAK